MSITHQTVNRTFSIMRGMLLTDELSGIEPWVASLGHNYWLMLMASSVSMGCLEGFLHRGNLLLPSIGSVVLKYICKLGKRVYTFVYVCLCVKHQSGINEGENATQQTETNLSFTLVYRYYKDFYVDVIMMTSSNGNIFRVTSHLCGDSPVPGEFPRTRAGDAELCCFLPSASEYTVE